MNYFLFDAGQMTELDLESGGDITLEKATEVFYHLSEVDGSFFGLQNAHETILQFAWENEDEWLVDMPLRGSKAYQLSCDFDTCVNIIASFFKGQTIPHTYNMKLNDI